ncbi:MAG: hypothetical protein Q9186_004550 [Xanthomendoza sp. 1 TL-2023]
MSSPLLTSAPTLPPPPPAVPLPSLPLEAKAQTPASTPRNASHLYGEFSWPSLDIATLMERLEDLAEEEQLGFSAVDGEEGIQNDEEEEDAAFGEILRRLVVGPKGGVVEEWLRGVRQEDGRYGSDGGEGLYYGCEEVVGVGVDGVDVDGSHEDDGLDDEKEWIESLGLMGITRAVGECLKGVKGRERRRGGVVVVV